MNNPNGYTGGKELLVGFFRAMNGFGFSLRLGWRDYGTGDIDIMQPITLQRHEKGEIIPDTSLLQFSEEEAQQVMDAMWNAGVRPSRECGSVGEKAALEKHIESLEREEAFKRQLIQDITHRSATADMDIR